MFAGLMYVGGIASEKIFRYFHHGKVNRCGYLSLFEKKLIERDARITGSKYIQNDSLYFSTSKPN